MARGPGHERSGRLGEVTLRSNGQSSANSIRDGALYGSQHIGRRLPECHDPDTRFRGKPAIGDPDLTLLRSTQVTSHRSTRHAVSDLSERWRYGSPAVSASPPQPQTHEQYHRFPK